MGKRSARTGTACDREAARDLRRIPGVGRSIAEDLLSLGVRTVSDLAGRDPEALFRRLRRARGGSMDRCVLYVFRCAVYFASHDRHDPEKLKWWNWKDSP